MQNSELHITWNIQLSFEPSNVQKKTFQVDLSIYRVVPFQFVNIFSILNVCALFLAYLQSLEIYHTKLFFCYLSLGHFPKQ